MSNIIEAKKEDNTFDFSEAIDRLLDGKFITKLEWKDKSFYGLIKDGYLSLHKPDGKYYTWLVSEADMAGTDWIEL